MTSDANTELSLNDGPVRLLMTGDLHLGRSSSRVPAAVPRDELRATTIWRRMVDLAIAEHASLVCLSGDIADQDNKFWEAIGPLEKGIARLADAGIRTVAVAGNHDFKVLMRLADQLPREHFHLLGRGGRWERLRLTQNGAPVLLVDGWSFPDKHVHDNPVNHYDLEREGSTPLLGMVHGDLYAASSPYAPLGLGLMQRQNVDGWLLGHLHAPVMHEGKPWVFYPGSPQAFDPGEPGAHGPWLAEVKDGFLTTPQQRPMSSVWYEELEINVGGLEDLGDFDHHLLRSIRERASTIVQDAGANCRHISLRLRLVGETALSDAIAEHTSDLAGGLELSVGDVSIGVDKRTVDTLPAIDLEQYARQQTAAGAVARLLQELDRGVLSEQVATLLQQTKRQLRDRGNSSAFSALDASDVDDSVVREHLRTQGRALLSRLVPR